MTLSETISEYLDLRDALNSDEVFPIPMRTQMREEMQSLKKEIDDFENMVYDMYIMLNRHDDQLNTIAMSSNVY